MPNLLSSLTITLETVTPLFSGGADNKTPELRSPPFRGMMRYWFRALAGGVVGDSKRALDLIREKEAEVFGSPDEVHGQSAVWIQLSMPAITVEDHFLLPHRNKANFAAISPGVSFTLTLTLKPRADIQKLEMAVWSLLVGLTLGGIGKRSRRGFGSLGLKDVEMTTSGLNENLIRHMKQARQFAASGEDLAKRIGLLLADARSAFVAFLDASMPQLNDLPRFSLLKQDTRIVVWEPGNSVRNYTAVLSPLMEKLSNLIRSEGKHNFEQAFGNIRPRRASPLWVSTHLLEGQKWALVLTHLRAYYLSNQSGNQHHLVAQFLDSPPAGWTKVEVTQ